MATKKKSKKASKAKAKPKPKAKKAPVKRAAKKKAVSKPKAKKAVKKGRKKQQAEKPKTVIAPPNSVLLGRVEDYFAQINVIALTLESGLVLGNRIQILGHTTHIEQAVDSMQIEHQPVQEAGPKAAVGIKVKARCRRGDHVFLLK